MWRLFLCILDCVLVLRCFWVPVCWLWLVGLFCYLLDFDLWVVLDMGLIGLLYTYCFIVFCCCVAAILLLTFAGTLMFGWVVSLRFGFVV